MIWIHDLGILYWSETAKKANTEIVLRCLSKTIVRSQPY